MEKGNKKTVTSNLPVEIFAKYDELEATGGTIDWGDVGVLNILSGNENTRTIVVQLEGQAGGYGEDMKNYHTTFYANIRAISRPINIKIIAGKDKWKNAVWDYQLQAGEKVNKSIEQSWTGRYGKLYRKYN